MDIELLDRLLKEDSRNCFEKFKHSISNNPIGHVDTKMIEDCIEFEINQGFAKKTVKEFISSNLSDKQMEYLESEINKYKELTLKTARNYAQKLIK